MGQPELLVVAEAPADLIPAPIFLGSAPGCSLDASGGLNFWGCRRHGEGGAEGS